MYWIALLPPHDDERTAWGWRALQFTPRVAFVDEALLLEVSASERLWGGRAKLLRQLVKNCEPLTAPLWAHGATSLIALALLRLKARGEKAPGEAEGGKARSVENRDEARSGQRELASRSRIPDALPLDTLTAAQEHVGTLERTGCRTWGGLRALPRYGVARRFGAELLDALDCAYGERPERYDWLRLPEEFDLKFELVALATSAPELMWAAQRLLSQLQVWLQARNRGVLALELEWTLDLRRLNGVKLPSHEQLVVRTAQPTQDIAHLRRLVNEHLSRATLAAPANHLRLRTLDTVPWGGADKSLLPEDNVQGERLHQLIERLSVRLGEGAVVMPQAQQDHRPEKMQKWERRANARATASSNALYPPWLLPHPLRLDVRNEKPHYHGPLRLLAGPQRLETGWWEPDARGPALRDYFIARSEEAGLLWVYRERLSLSDAEAGGQAPVRWYLHGIYA
jgi:protein ImuB